jgi:MYXO-CTERM domain-containing protein
LAPATAGAVASAELFREQPYRYGRFEARIRYAVGDGVVSSFFLWKVGSEVTGTYWNELDFEKLNADCRMQTNTLYGYPLQSAEQTRTMPTDMCTAYHDYRFEWTPTYIAWFIDAQEIRRETGAVAAAFADNTPDGMRIHFNVWPGNANFGGNFNPSILPVRQYISWVQYSSFQNGSFQVAWREEFDGPGVPSGWATGTWASPYSLSTHDPRNVTFANGIAVLSLTADNATGFTGTPPADNGGGGMAGRGGAGGAGNAGATNGGANAGGTGKGGSTAGGANAGGGAGGSKAGGGSGVGGSMTSGGAAGAPQAGKGGAMSGGTPNAGSTSGGAGNPSTSSGGTATGGMTTAGAGQSTTGGTIGAGGSSTGNLSGGTLSGGASSGGSTSGAPAMAGNGGAASSSGCGCRMAPPPRSRGFALALGLAMLTTVAARRRARTSKRRLAKRGQP